jgi:hypothetical protein
MSGTLPAMLAGTLVATRGVVTRRAGVSEVGPSRRTVREVEDVAVSRRRVVVSRAPRVVRVTSAAPAGGIPGATLVGTAAAVRRGVSHDVVRLRVTTADGCAVGGVLA